MMKKLIALLCAAALAFTVVGCSSASSDSTGSDSSSSESASTSESTPETDVDPEEPATPPEGGDTTDGRADRQHLRFGGPGHHGGHQRR